MQKNFNIIIITTAIVYIVFSNDKLFIYLESTKNLTETKHYCFSINAVNGCIHSIYDSVVPSPAIGVSVSTSASIVIGSELNLTCVVFELFSGLTQSPMAIWATTTSILGSIETTTTTNRTVVVLNINPLRASHPVTYTCLASIFTPVDSRTQMIQETIMIRPQS